MDLKERMVKLIQDITGDENADLWTLKFDENDSNATIDQISPQYFNGMKARTLEDARKDAEYVLKDDFFSEYAA